MRSAKKRLWISLREKEIFLDGKRQILRKKRVRAAKEPKVVILWIIERVCCWLGVSSRVAVMKLLGIVEDKANGSF